MKRKLSTGSDIYLSKYDLGVPDGRLRRDKGIGKIKSDLVLDFLSRRPGPFMSVAYVSQQVHIDARELSRVRRELEDKGSIESVEVVLPGHLRRAFGGWDGGRSTGYSITCVRTKRGATCLKRMARKLATRRQKSSEGLAESQSAVEPKTDNPTP